MPGKKLNENWYRVNRLMCWIIVILLCAIALDLDELFRAAIW